MTPARGARAEGDDLDGFVRAVDPDRWLASRFVADRARRADLIALYAFDGELARVRRMASNPLLAEIRLTWWREAVEEIHACGPVRLHPAARALAETARRRALPRDPLETMVDARLEMLGKPRLNIDEALRWADGVGASTAALAARVLDPAAPPEAAVPAGLAWGLVLLRRAGLAWGADFDRRMDEALVAASQAARALSAAAFPAVAHAALARVERRSGPLSDLEKRARLVWAVARGRL
ncbi:MAG: squalene/phytoene synthase family protein [Caulobacteraceae bacterium]